MSSPLRCVQAAHLRLDAPLRCGDDAVRAQLARAARQALVDLVDLCLAEEAQALVLEGELFDIERLTLSGEDLLAQQLGRLAEAGVRSVLPAETVQSARGASIRWPRAQLTLSEAAPAAVPGLPGLPRNDELPPLFGRHHGESGPAGARLLTLRAGAPPQVEFRAVARVTWATLDLSGALSALTGRAELLQAALAAFEARRTESTAGAAGVPATQWMLRVRLAGPCPSAAELADPALLAELGHELQARAQTEGVLLAEFRDEGLHRPVDGAEAHRGAPDLLGLSLEVVEELASDPELLQRLAPATLGGALSPTSGRAEWLAGLLPGLPPVTAEALLRRNDA
ncbi:MAG: hypothetical protein ACT4PU_01080 [Planctomycetota bacterium]